MQKVEETFANRKTKEQNARSTSTERLWFQILWIRFPDYLHVDQRFTNQVDYHLNIFGDLFKSKMSSDRCDPSGKSSLSSLVPRLCLQLRRKWNFVREVITWCWYNFASLHRGSKKVGDRKVWIRLPSIGGLVPSRLTGWPLCALLSSFQSSLFWHLKRIWR
jgi:hypothetical protein